MSKAIPAKMTPVARVVEEVCLELGSKGNFQPQGADIWVRDVMLVWEEPIEHVAFLLDAKAPLLAVYITLHLPDSKDHSDRLAKALARANYGLLPGCFEIDTDSGEIRYRSILMPVSKETDDAYIAGLIADALVMTQTYALAFQKIIASDADPIESIDEVER
jgi:hypothetical protein